MHWLQFRRAGEAIEIVQAPNMTVELLASGDGTEIIRHTMEPGANFGMSAQTGWYALEFLMVLEGELAWKQSDSDVILRAGDNLTALPVQEDVFLTAITPVAMLYVSSQPVFRQASGQIAALMEACVAVEQKDGATYDHCSRIQRLAVRVGSALGLPTARLMNLSDGAFLHDLGKVGIPESILGKPGRLTEQEYALMKTHPTIGREMLEETFLKEVGVILAQHHERLDGSGYPHGLRGDEILLESQIVAVVDSYDAMVSDRIYSKGRPVSEALAELQAGAGRLYRADVVAAFLAVLGND